MESPNRMALDLVDEAIDFADELHVGVEHLEDDAAVLDFGVHATGGVEAGLLLAEVATGGLATVQTRVGTVDGVTLPHVELSTDHPALALLGCQSPRWSLDADGVEARASGPAQLLRADVAGDSPATTPDDDADFAVLVLGADRLPGEALVETVADVTNVPTSAVFALVAPTNSVAGGVAAAARAAERALHRLAAVGHDPGDARSVTASAPVAPLAPTEAEARARSTAAVAGGGRVHLVVGSEVADPDGLAGAGSGDVTAPAQVTLDVADGPVHVAGGVDERQLAADLGL